MVTGEDWEMEYVMAGKSRYCGRGMGWRLVTLPSQL